ncbi:hypothetical protein [Helcococcus massiliensis]|uniref:hypothetical protein n=1 Tax=Helcococcus massiliensis TaxID=2040290 RepID=UPI000CDEED78|nr:hypothetical protein [Helcococcus massiliensis]
MWLLFGVLAIIFMLVNIISAIKNKKEEIFGFLSLAFTALTVNDFYADVAKRLAVPDIDGIMDIVPTVSEYLWFCVGASIVLNGIAIFLRRKNK